MFGSDKTQMVPQLLQQKKQAKKNSKPIYRELLDTEKSLLLNFQYSENHDHHEHFSDIRPLKTKQLSFLEKKQLKQNYLQGNFRFFVSPDYEENITYVDPDQEIKWKTVEKVKYITNNVVSCPICLNEYYDTVFPKITRCGHIFCWPCILKYLSYKNSKCPLCDDFLMKEDLRTVQIMYYTIIQPGEKIFLKLKKRRKSENTIYNGEDLIEEEDFTRIKRVSWDDILKFREEESRSLIDYLSVLEIQEDRDMKPYVQQALDYIGSSMEKIQRISAQAKQKKVWANEEEEKHEEIPNAEEFLYFYQEMNGLNIFLHPIDNKYVKIEFESKDLPLFIEASLIESRGFQQSEVSQRRYKFLNHIPLNSDISFVEIDMRDILSKERQMELEEEMKNYKETYASKKELATKLTTHHSTPPVIPKSITVPAEGKYKVEFPASPSGLKLSDKQDYPELTPSNSHVLENPKHSGWHSLAPSKKKTQGSKKNSTQVTLTSKNIDNTSDKTENQTESFNDKIQTTSMNSDNEWKEVKPDKSYLYNKRK